MKSVDVSTQIDIRRPRAAVAAFATDPDNATAWYANIESIAWCTDPPLAVGSRMDFVARFLGRRLAYTYEVTAWKPDAHLVMRTDEGPFPMETTYMWEDLPDGATRMTPLGFAKVAGGAMSAAMRRANRKDLRQLRDIVEARGA